MRSRLWPAAVAVALLVLAGCGGDEPPATTPPLVEQLREGGHVLVLRHTATETATDERERLRSCSLQRNLSAEGRRQARALGAAIRTLGIPVGAVVTSPLCRARDTARLLALGRVRTDRTLVSPGVVGTIEDDDRRARALRRRVAAMPPAGANTVLVTHTGNIGGAFGESVLEGEMLVFRGGRLVARVTPEEWIALARAAAPG